MVAPPAQSNINSVTTENTLTMDQMTTRWTRFIKVWFQMLIGTVILPNNFHGSNVFPPNKKGRLRAPESLRTSRKDQRKVVMYFDSAIAGM